MLHFSPPYLIASAIFLSACMVGGCSTENSMSTPSRGIILKEQPAEPSPLLYAVYVPRSYDASRSWPCILFLHGSGESGTDGLKQVIQGLGGAIQWNESEWPFIVLFPQKPVEREQWEFYDAPVMAMLARAKSDYNIDADRVYLTGLSQGGHGAWAFASRHPGTFAAIAPICGYDRPFTPTHIADTIGNVPVWAFHGLADDVVRPVDTTTIIEAINAARAGKADAAEVKMSLYEGVNHGSWDRAYRTEHLGAWFLSHRRAKDATK
ncbi:MAG: dienelactone hydrolase family protein [Pyrinomonadaceae bacterium]|nr:dienelactone hydrolase family protein [Phycisphaerales bacterium]